MPIPPFPLRLRPFGRAVGRVQERRRFVASVWPVRFPVDSPRVFGGAQTVALKQNQNIRSVLFVRKRKGNRWEWAKAQRAVQKHPPRPPSPAQEPGSSHPKKRIRIGRVISFLFTLPGFAPDTIDWKSTMVYSGVGDRSLPVSIVIVSLSKQSRVECEEMPVSREDNSY